MGELGDRPALPPSRGSVVLATARTGAAVAAVGVALGVGGLVALATGDRRRAGNLVTSVAPGLVLALAGIRLEVSGADHLWSHRPAVFVFNHQSTLDIVIMGRLLRRDVTALAKKEAAGNLLFAPIGALVGVAYVDRGNRGQTRTVVEPVLQRLADGISVAIAPEGTRSRTLGPFKKGAFHIAMRAGVPLVPIVVRHAGELMPKGSLLARPGRVHVTVLPPVSTAGWTVASLGEHVGELRGQFVRMLAEP